MRPRGWVEIDGGIRRAGHDGSGFCFDNETPRHETLVQPLRIADRLIANREWFEFMADGGYSNPALWLSDGWALIRQEGWVAPLYFEERDGQWLQMTLSGLVVPDPAAAGLPRQLLRG